MSSNTDIVRQFVADWSKNDVPTVMAYFTDDCVYHNIPMDPVQGTDAILATVNGFAGMSEEIQWDLLAIAESADGVVLTERVDKFKIAGNWIELPVMGTFELRDGKISAWRDYFDMNQFTSQVPGMGGE